MPNYLYVYFSWGLMHNMKGLGTAFLALILFGVASENTVMYN